MITIIMKTKMSGISFQKNEKQIIEINQMEIFYKTKKYYISKNIIKCVVTI